MMNKYYKVIIENPNERIVGVTFVVADNTLEATKKGVAQIAREKHIAPVAFKYLVIETIERVDK